MRTHPLSPLAEELALMPDAPCAQYGARRAELIDADYDELVAFHGIERERLVLIHPGSHGAAPAWPVERYAEVADQLAADGWQIAIVGDALEPERTGAVLGAMQTAALFLAGTMSPETLTRLIGDARLVLSDDAATPSPVARGPRARHAADRARRTPRRRNQRSHRDRRARRPGARGHRASGRPVHAAHARAARSDMQA